MAVGKTAPETPYSGAPAAPENPILGPQLRQKILFRAIRHLGPPHARIPYSGHPFCPKSLLYAKNATIKMQSQTGKRIYMLRVQIPFLMGREIKSSSFCFQTWWRSEPTENRCQVVRLSFEAKHSKMQETINTIPFPPTFQNDVSCSPIMQLQNCKSREENLFTCEVVLYPPLWRDRKMTLPV